MENRSCGRLGSFGSAFRDRESVVAKYTTDDDRQMRFVMRAVMRATRDFPSLFSTPPLARMQLLLYLLLSASIDNR